MTIEIQMDRNVDVNNGLHIKWFLKLIPLEGNRDKEFRTGIYNEND